MGVVRDVTIEELTQAVQGISSSGMTDTTGQAIVSAISGIDPNTQLGNISSAITALAGSISPTADNVSFDNTGTDLTSSDVEGAISELDTIKVSGNAKIMMGAVGSSATATPLVITSRIAYVITSGNSTLTGFFACRPGNIQELITKGSSVGYSVNDSTYTFTNSNTSLTMRYIAFLIDE